MKVKYSVIPFIPVAIAMVGLKIMSLFGLDSNGLLFGMNKTSVSYLVIGLALGLFVLCIFINILDRKTAPVYGVKKNFVSGVLAVFSGFAVAASSIISFLHTSPSNSDNYYMSLVVSLFSVFAGVALILMSKVHFIGKSTVSGISMMYIFPALWGCSCLVSEFLAATKVSISASDMTPLFCYIFVTLYLFSHAMIVSRIKGRNPVKACFVYGLPMVAVSLSYGIYVILTSSVENSGIHTIMVGVQFSALALYALSFIIEMFFGTLTKDEVEIIDTLPEEEDTYVNSYINSGSYDEILISDRKDSETNAANNDEIIPDLSGLDDFVMGYNEEDRDIVRMSNKSDVLDSVILDSGADKTPDLVEDIVATSDADSKIEKTAAANKKAVSGGKEKENVSETEKAENTGSVNNTNSVSTEKTVQGTSDEISDSRDNDVISSDRLSQIDRLLKELEGKK